MTETIRGVTTDKERAYYGASGAVSGFNFELYRAFYGRDDEYLKARYELWKETSGAVAFSVVSAKDPNIKGYSAYVLPEPEDD